MSRKKHLCQPLRPSLRLRVAVRWVDAAGWIPRVMETGKLAAAVSIFNPEPERSYA